jgi:branched-chain amino acid transport system ATP-binding protein
VLLRIENLKAFYGGFQALWGVSLEVPERMIVALLGANGAGKSTLLTTVSGLVPGFEGKIEFQGQSLERLTPNQIVRLGIVHCPEGRRVFSQLTVFDNLKMGGYLCRHDKRKLKESFDRVMEYFPVLRERKKQKAGSLSGGEQQMLAIARALVADPKLLLIDEASLGLAPLLIADLLKIIQRINQDGTSILLVEQNARMALSIAHYGYVLEMGKIVFHGKSDDLCRDERVVQSYLGMT